LRRFKPVSGNNNAVTIKSATAKLQTNMFPVSRRSSCNKNMN